MFPTTPQAKMAGDSNLGFHFGFSPSTYNRSIVSVQSGAMSSHGSMTAPTSMSSSSGGMGGLSGTMMAGNQGLVGHSSPVVNTGNAYRNILPDPVPGLRCDPGMSVDWSLEEQSILKEGLAKYEGLSNIMKYIKIAATLREKTVRDVALRCRWMNRKENCKRRKQDELLVGKKIKDTKNKQVDVSSNVSVFMRNSGGINGHSLMMDQAKSNYQFPREANVVDATTGNLMDENTEYLYQITSNFAAFKIQDNVDLFVRLRNNFADILNRMSKTDGIMRAMPPFPEQVNEDLFRNLHHLNQADIMRGPQSTIHSAHQWSC